MKRSDLPIPSPCSENWDTMTAVGKTLFCATCKKHVHDLTRMSEDEARVVLAATRRGDQEICVRYLHDAHGDLVFQMVDTRLVPATRLAKAKRALAFGTALVGVSAIAACASTPQAQPEMYGGAVACPTERPADPAASGSAVPPSPPSTASGPEAPVVPAPSGQTAPLAK